MKNNIHILSTDKPSRLHFTEFFEELVFTPKYEKLDGVNIYITSDEEIKEGDWIFDLDVKKVLNADNLKVTTSKKSQCWYYKKIILTTDQGLIKDGVQAIDDEFLEWFVNNPSCEKVEVHKIVWNVVNDFEYKIIIPKEEPKKVLTEEDIFNQKDIDAVTDYINKKQHYQYLIDMMKDDEELGLYDDTEINRTELICKDCSDSLEDCACIEDTVDFPRQETFEDYLQRLKDRRTEDDYKYTDEDFIKYEEYIRDCCKNGMSVYKCLEFMYFAKKDMDDQLFNREPRQEIKLEEVFNDEKKENIKKFIDEINNPSQPNDKLKQAFEKYSEYLEDYENKNTYEHGFKDGAKCQQEISYSEEEVLGIIRQYALEEHLITSSKPDIWFAQNKKK